MNVIIPARLGSTRLPGKMLADLAGQPLVIRVMECARRSGAERVIVATDDTQIRNVVVAHGGEAVMTRADHMSGTDRIAEVVEKLELPENSVVVNLQGDEPLMPAELIRAVGDLLSSRPEAAMATACHVIRDRDDFLNPNIVKVVTDQEGFALYFSRAPVPWPRDAMRAPSSGSIKALRHIGLYAYRAGFVSRFASWPACPLELTESLEQLRVLWHGERIAVVETDEAPATGVDTEEDLVRVRHIFSTQSALASR